MSLIKQSISLAVLGAILFTFQLFAFTEPSANPPLGNVPAPLNVGSSGQSKSGGLILNTGGASYGLIVDQGSVGIGTQSPTQKLDVIGYIRGATGLCIGGDCRTGWPTGEVNTDNQTLSVSGQQMSISGGNSVTLPPGRRAWVSLTQHPCNWGIPGCPSGYILYEITPFNNPVCDEPQRVTICYKDY